MADPLTIAAIAGLILGGIGNFQQARQSRDAAGDLAAANLQAAQLQYDAAMKGLQVFQKNHEQTRRALRPFYAVGMAAYEDIASSLGIDMPEGTFDVGETWDKAVEIEDPAGMASALEQAEVGQGAGDPMGGAPKPLIAGGDAEDLAKLAAGGGAAYLAKEYGPQIVGAAKGLFTGAPAAAGGIASGGAAAAANAAAAGVAPGAMTFPGAGFAAPAAAGGAATPGVLANMAPAAGLALFALGKHAFDQSGYEPGWNKVPDTPELQALRDAIPSNTRIASPYGGEPEPGPSKAELAYRDARMKYLAENFEPRSGRELTADEKAFVARSGRYIRNHEISAVKKYGPNFVSSRMLTPEERRLVTQRFGVPNRNTKPETLDAIQQYQQQLWAARNQEQ